MEARLREKETDLQREERYIRHMDTFEATKGSMTK